MAKKIALSTIDIYEGKLAGFEYPQYVIKVNDLTINDYLNLHTKSDYFRLLVPSIALDSRSDQKIVLEKIEMLNTTLPILVCSDDMDFSCTVVCVQVVKDKNFVLWKYFSFGTDMDDYISVPALKFTKENYYDFTQKFKGYIYQENRL